jgi:hypothetical protein
MSNLHTAFERLCLRQKGNTPLFLIYNQEQILKKGDGPLFVIRRNHGFY